MSMQQRYEFFAPIWRVMRDSHLSADEVREQVEYVALAVKQGSQVGMCCGFGLCWRVLSWSGAFQLSGVVAP